MTFNYKYLSKVRPLSISFFLFFFFLYFIIKNIKYSELISNNLNFGNLARKKILGARRHRILFVRSLGSFAFKLSAARCVIVTKTPRESRRLADIANHFVREDPCILLSILRE
ncbi:hypothetical protein PUN28_003518 [Cardiocondyla obscurior]|uniref:Uncharacterized protein n=1 Tax=Cardiocondyla obscurior TaxID=286306 RepID=A0AAW2GMH7_9HYME